MAKLKMQEAAEELVREVDKLLPRARRRSPNAADHLERAAEAVDFNIGEGIAALRPRVKVWVYEIAKREAGEVRVILNRLVFKGVFTSSEVRRAMSLATVTTAMVSSAMRTLSSDSTATESRHNE